MNISIPDTITAPSPVMMPVIVILLALIGLIVNVPPTAIEPLIIAFVVMVAVLETVIG